jgi:hypothetical protein
LKADEIRNVESEGDFAIEKQFRLARNALVKTNSDGGGYQTDGASRLDTNNDNDDFDGLSLSTSQTLDNDADAFKYRYGVLSSKTSENALFVDANHRKIAKAEALVFSGFVALSESQVEYELDTFDGDTYARDGRLVLKDQAFFDGGS